MRAAARRDPKVNWPTTLEGWCDWWKGLDIVFLTPKGSPLHHDNRCALHARRTT